MTRIKRLRSLALATLCALTGSQAQTRVNPPPPNFLIILADDLGQDALRCYNPKGKVAVTPNIDRLCRQGVKFTNAWSQPSCTPSRTALLTGRYGFRTGSLTPAGPLPGFVQRPEAPKQLADNDLLGAAVDSGRMKLPDNAPFMVIRRTGKPPADLVFGEGPRDAEVTLPQALRRLPGSNYATAAIGKWHLSGPRPDLAEHPARLGFDHFAGGLLGSVENYYYHRRIVDGQDRGWSTHYATSQQVDDARDWIAGRGTAKPWFLWLALNAPHDPYHKPPNALISPASQALDPAGITPANAQLYHRAMIEALDHEIGRLLDGLDKAAARRTYIIFLGDNGTVGPLAQPPFQPHQGKGSMYQGGINAPMIVYGPGVRARTERAMVNFVDLFPTILAMAGSGQPATGASAPNLDGVSFAGLLAGRGSRGVRPFNFAEQAGFMPTGYKREVAVSDGRFKLIVNEVDGREQLFDLARDPYERAELIGKSSPGGSPGRWQAALRRLRLAIRDMRTGKGA